MTGRVTYQVYFEDNVGSDLILNAFRGASIGGYWLLVNDLESISDQNLSIISHYASLINQALIDVKKFKKKN
jgi:hypothetical protein